MAEPLPVAGDSADDRRRRSERALAERFPLAWARVESAAPPASSVVEGPEGPDNISLGSGHLYGAPARQWARIQLDGYRQAPQGIYFDNPNYCNISPVSLVLARRLTDFIREGGWTSKVAALPVLDIGYVFVFGVGLGYHLADLVATTRARHIVLIEPLAEFIGHSCQAIDWAELIAAADARAIQFHFVLDNKPLDISRSVEKLVVKHGNIFLDGSTFCLHYYSWTLKQTYGFLQERLKHFYISNGFFEDEIEMIRNTYENVRACSFHLVEGRPHLQQDFPVFIVGSGPSFDKDVHYIKKWRDKAIVISCGTALRGLLRNGIRPDLHCENERVPLVPEILRAVDAEFGLKGITLMATTTMFPEVANLFDERWFYFRDGLSPATVLNPGYKPLYNADPLVSNAAFAVATFMGFQNVYLFGMDLGQREGGAHHAKDAVYNDKDRGELDTLYVKRFQEARIVPGNFGGRVRTFWAFDMGRRMLGEVQHVRRINLYNCSDGARITGAKPQLAAGIDLSHVVDDKARVLRQVAGEMRRFEAGQVLEGIDLQKTIDGFDRLREELATLIAEQRTGHAEFWDILEAIDALPAKLGNDLQGVFALVRSSMRSMVRLGAFFGNRIADDDLRHAFIDHFLTHYEERCRAMADEAQALLRTILDERTASPA